MLRDRQHYAGAARADTNHAAVTSIQPLGIVYSLGLPSGEAGLGGRAPRVWEACLPSFAPSNLAGVRALRLGVASVRKMYGPTLCPTVPSDRL